MNAWQKEKVELLAIKFLPLHRLDCNYSKIKFDTSLLKQNFFKTLTTHLVKIQKMLDILVVFSSNLL